MRLESHTTFKQTLMNKFYNTTVGQLVTMWIFGLLGLVVIWGLAMDLTNTFGSLVSGVLILAILFFLVFYTIGWTNNRKR